MIRRVTTIAEVVRNWGFFREGIEYEAKYLRYTYSLDVYRRILFHLVYRNPKAWVGVAYDDSDPLQPLAFVLAHDITPLFAETREFEVSMFYFRKGYKYQIGLLQQELDKFCREKGISRYYLTTSSFCSSAERVFKDSWRGLERSNTVFKRQLK